MYKDKIKTYLPKTLQEVIDKKAIVRFIENNDDALFRTNLTAHITSSALVFNNTLTKVLFAHHNIYDSWGWVGGHNDGDPDLLHVAIKEAKEETGIMNIYPYNKDILGIETIYVKNHMKNGEFIPDHLHLNATFLLIGDEDDTLTVKDDENSAVRWFDVNEVFDYVSEERIKTVYAKLFKEVEKIRTSSL